MPYITQTGLCEEKSKQAKQARKSRFQPLSCPFLPYVRDLIVCGRFQPVRGRFSDAPQRAPRKMKVNLVVFIFFSSSLESHGACHIPARSHLTAKVKPIGTDAVIDLADRRQDGLVDQTEKKANTEEKAQPSLRYRF